MQIKIIKLLEHLEEYGKMGENAGTELIKNMPISYKEKIYHEYFSKELSKSKFLSLNFSK